jgi:CheY-like chemotaxis protein
MVSYTGQVRHYRILTKGIQEGEPKMDFYGKFKGLEDSLPKKVLVVDDTQQYREKYANLVKDMGLRVIQAENVQDGIEKALAEKPDAIITDKDMPDGTGSDLAKAVKQAYDVKIAGITGGNPEEFDDHIDVKLSKDISDEDYKTLVSILLESKHPEADFLVATGKYKGEFVEAVKKAIDEYVAIDILAQGYILAKQLQRGEDPLPGVENLELKVPSEEQAQKMLEIDDIGVDPQALHEAYIALKHAAAGKTAPADLVDAAKQFAQEPGVKVFVDKIAAEPKAIQEEDCIAFHEAFAKIVEEYNKVQK